MPKPSANTVMPDSAAGNQTRPGSSCRTGDVVCELGWSIEAHEVPNTRQCRSRRVGQPLPKSDALAFRLHEIRCSDCGGTQYVL